MLGGFVRLLKNEDGLRVFGCDPILGVIRDRRGAVAILLAVALSAIVGFAGLGSEVAGWYYTTRSMQSASDASATSAAAALAYAELSAGTTQCPTSSNFCQDEARAIAATLNFANGSNSTTVTVNNPPATTTNLTTCGSPFTSYNCYVEVIISQPQPALLSALFMSSGPTITTRSVALANTGATDAGCVVALSRQTGIDLNVSGTASMNFSGCALYDNASGSNALLMNGNGASITAKAAYVVGGVNGGSQVTTTDGIFTGVNPIPDPYASVPTPSYSGCNQTNFKLSGQGQNSSATLPPATFTGSVYVFCNGIDLTSNNVSLTLRPGFVYVIDQGQLQIGGNSTLTQCGSTYTGGPTYAACTVGPASQSGGVTIFLTNHTGGNPATTAIPSNSNVNLTAPNSGTYSGMAIFQDRVACSSTCTSTFNGGANFKVTGALYFPKNDVSFAGGSATGSGCTQLVANTITLTGNSQFNSTCQSAGTKTISYTNGTLTM